MLCKPFVEQVIKVAIVLVNQLCHVILVLDACTCLVLRVMLEGRNFLISEADTLGREQLIKHVKRDLTCALRVQNLKGGEQSFCRCWLIIVFRHCRDNELLDFVGGNVLRRLVLLKLWNDDITHLSFGWKLKAVSQDVGDLTLVDGAFVFGVDDTDCLLDDLLVVLKLIFVFLRG